MHRLKALAFTGMGCPTLGAALSRFLKNRVRPSSRLPSFYIVLPRLFRRPPYPAPRERPSCRYVVHDGTLSVPDLFQIPRRCTQVASINARTSLFYVAHFMHSEFYSSYLNTLTNLSLRLGRTGASCISHSVRLSSR